MKRILFAAMVFFFASVSLIAARDRASPLVNVAWLLDNAANEGVVVLDIRPSKSHAAGHFPGSVSAPYQAGWRKTIDGVVGMRPPVDELTGLIRKKGIDNDDHVIILPHGKSSTDFAAATRVFWTFRVLGHEKVSILDGGYEALIRKGVELSTESIRPEEGSFTANFRPELVTFGKDVQEKMGTAANLVDARPQAQFLGRSKSPVVRRAGTIPGASNLEQSSLYDTSSASFVDAETLTRLARAARVSDTDEIITFCNTGHWASIAWFALSEIAGRENVSLYDGSMAEWTLEDSNPVQ